MFCGFAYRERVPILWKMMILELLSLYVLDFSVEFVGLGFF